MCVNEQPDYAPIVERAWSGVIESKSQNWTIDQIAAHCGKAEHVVRILKIGEYGAVENITDAVLDFMEQDR